MTSESHGRYPRACRWHDASPMHWPCEACQKDYAANVNGRLKDQPGKCRCAQPYALPARQDPNARITPRYSRDAEPRQQDPGGSQSSSSQGRQGVHPRPPRPRALDDPAADASARDVTRPQAVQGQQPQAAPDRQYPVLQTRTDLLWHLGEADVSTSHRALIKHLSHKKKDLSTKEPFIQTRYRHTAPS